MKIKIKLLIVMLILTVIFNVKAQKIDKKIFEQLKENKDVFVIIALKDPGLKLTFQERLKTINSIQNEVLEELGEDFFPVYIYESVSAMAGYIKLAGIKKLERLDNVLQVKLDEQIHINLAESVPAINADDVHNLGFTGEGVNVGVLDTGIDTDHPDLSDDIIATYHFLYQGLDTGVGAEDDNGHGTFVSGIISSAGNVASVGVAPDAGIVAVKVLDYLGIGYESDFIAGINWIVSHNNTLYVKVINMSFGSSTLFNSICDSQNQAMYNAVQSARAAGIVCIAASGNEGSTTSMASPACLSNTISVGATFDGDLGRQPPQGTWQSNYGGSLPDCYNATTSITTIACFTNRNSYLDILAPGCWITSCYVGGGTVDSVGTSASAPHVSGVAALMFQKNRFLEPSFVENTLKNTGVPVNDPDTGNTYPLVDALAAINQVPINTVPSLNFYSIMILILFFSTLFFKKLR